MSFERDQSHAHEHDGPSAASHDHDVAPGRRAASSQLVASSHPITSALIQRKAARDGNGVAADASAHVDRAASSSGSPLPADLRSRFESSLGADLSSVRVHTGDASANAAQAVGAKAYTTGQDIHFAAGNYDPTSSAGQHLLAHEVAHTVQQRGVAPVRQNKLEVSTPQDHAEVEADRAADAVMAGVSFDVSPVGTGIHRKPDDRNPLTAEPKLPRPLYWSSPIDEDIEGQWTGKPEFTFAATGGLSASGLEWVNRVDGMKKAFSATWVQAQANWNNALPAFKEYRDASQDAENKGLADFGGKGFDIDLDSDMTDFGGRTSVSDAYLQDGNKITAGEKTYNSRKVDSPLRRSIIDLKSAASVAQDDVETSERGITTAHTNLDSAKVALANAVGTLSADKDSKRIEDLNREIDMLKKSSALVGAAIGSMSKTKGSVAGLVEGGGAALQMINTFAWESAIHDIESQIQVLQGGIRATGINNARNVAHIAENTVANAVRALKDRLGEYKKKCAAYKKAFATLAASLEKATLQSGGSVQQAQRVRAAVEAIPLMELTLQKCQALLSRCVSVPESPDACAGGGLAANGPELARHNGILISWNGQMSDAVARWDKRLTLARQLVRQAH